MKNIVLILVLILFGLSLKAQSLQSFGLKGKVKSIQEELLMCSHKYGKAQTNDCSSLTSEKQFSTDGYFVEKEREVEVITREKKDTPSGFIETVYKKEKDLKIKLRENYYNKENLMLNSISYQSDTIFNLTKYFYDEMGRKTKKEEIAYIEGVREKTISFFDEYETFCGFEIYRNEVLSDQGKFDVKYEFDEKGNWIQSIVITEFSTDIHKRTFTYY